MTTPGDVNDATLAIAERRLQRTIAGWLAAVGSKALGIFLLGIGAGWGVQFVEKNSHRDAAFFEVVVALMLGIVLLKALEDAAGLNRSYFSRVVAAAGGEGGSVVWQVVLRIVILVATLAVAVGVPLCGIAAPETCPLVGWTENLVKVLDRGKTATDANSAFAPTVLGFTFLGVYGFLVVSAHAVAEIVRLDHLLETFRSLSRSLADTRPLSWAPGATAGGEPPNCLVVHASDFHLCIGQLTVEGKPHAGREFVIEQLKSAAAAAKARMSAGVEGVVVASGDLTDLGKEAEFAQLEEAISSLPLPVLLLPGNHDININHGGTGSGWAMDSSLYEARALRMCRFIRRARTNVVKMEELYWCWDARDRVLTPALGELEKALRAAKGFEAAVASSTKWWFASGAAREVLFWWQKRLTFFFPNSTSPFDAALRESTLLALETAWAGLFPFVLWRKKTGVAFVGLDSNAKSSYLLSNAFGHVAESTLDRLDDLLLYFRSRDTKVAPIVCLHHHVCTQPSDVDTEKSFFERLKSRGLVLDNSAAFLQVLRNNRVGLVLHGHRHQQRRLVLPFEGSTHLHVLGAVSLGQPGEGGGLHLLALHSDGGAVRVVSDTRTSNLEPEAR